MVEREILPTPLLYLSAFFEAARRDYYERLQGVTEQGDWEGWLQYFLNGVARQSEDALDRAAKINHLLVAWRKVAADTSSKVPLRLVEALGTNPYLTLTGASRQLKVAFTTVQRAAERLQKLGIVKEVSGQQRNRVYCATALLSILEAPAQLSPNA